MRVPNGKWTAETDEMGAVESKHNGVRNPVCNPVEARYAWRPQRVLCDYSVGAERWRWRARRASGMQISKALIEVISYLLVPRLTG